MMKVFIFVPLNFGFKADNEELTLYFHGFVKGKKIDLIKKNKLAGFEMDRKHEIVKAEIACDYSFLYQSIIGKGNLFIIEDKDEKIDALQYLMEQYKHFHHLVILNGKYHTAS